MADPEPIPVYYPTYGIAELIETILETLVSNTTGVIIKGDVELFEGFPAIGVGMPFITEVDEIGQSDKVDIDVPVAIVDAGTRSYVSLNVTKIYEQFRYALTKLAANLATKNLPVEVAKIGNFQPMPTPEDQSVRGLTGTLSFRLILKIEEGD